MANGCICFCKNIYWFTFRALTNSKMLAFIRLSTLSRLFLLIPWATPPVVSVIAWRWMIDPTGGPINQLLLNLVSSLNRFLLLRTSQFGQLLPQQLFGIQHL